jgi:hypothetical protein
MCALEEDKFDRVESVRIIAIETKYRVKDFMESWNRSVHLWLKNYIFLRLVRKGV